MAAMFGSTWWCSWLRHCATSQKVAGSIPDGVTGIFHWHYPSGHTMILELTQPLNRNEYQVRLVCRADNLTTFMSWNLGASTSWNPMGLSRPIMGFRYLYGSHVYYCGWQGIEKEHCCLVDLSWGGKSSSTLPCGFFLHMSELLLNENNVSLLRKCRQLDSVI
jgi:hypothetical protein